MSAGKIENWFFEPSGILANYFKNRKSDNPHWTDTRHCECAIPKKQYYSSLYWTCKNCGHIGSDTGNVNV